MTKYYTIDQILKQSFDKDHPKAFTKRPVTEFTQGLYNCARVLFGYEPKIYYFVEKKEK